MGGSTSKDDDPSGISGCCQARRGSNERAWFAQSATPWSPDVVYSVQRLRADAGHRGEGEIGGNSSQPGAIAKPLSVDPARLEAEKELDRLDMMLRSLHIAAEIGDTEFVTSLIQSGDCAIEGRDEEGRTALHLSAANGHIETANALIALGADIGAFDKQMRTPLMLAAMNSKYDMVYALERRCLTPRGKRYLESDRRHVQYNSNQQYPPQYQPPSRPAPTSSTPPPYRSPRLPENGTPRTNTQSPWRGASPPAVTGENGAGNPPSSSYSGPVVGGAVPVVMEGGVDSAKGAETTRTPAPTRQRLDFH